MPRIPSAEQLGERPQPRPGPLPNYSGVGAGVQRGTALIGQAADDVRRDTAESARQLAQFGAELGAAESQIRTRNDAVARARDFGSFNEKADAELRRIQTESDMARPETMDAYSKFLDKTIEDATASHSGSNDSRLAFNARLLEARTHYAGQAASLALEEGKKQVNQHMGSALNTITSRAWNKPGSLAENFRMWDREVDDMAAALGPSQETTLRKAGRERIAEASVGALIAMGGLDEAKRLLQTPGVDSILGEQAQTRINTQLLAAERAINDATNAGLRKRAELRAVLGRDPTEDEVRVSIGLAPKTAAGAQSDLGKLAADRKAGLIDEATYQAGVKKHTEGTQKPDRVTDTIGDATSPTGTRIIPRDLINGNQPLTPEVLSKYPPGPPSQGLNIEFGADGKPTKITTGRETPKTTSGLTPGEQGDVEKKLIAATGDLMQMNDVVTKFNPEFHTFAGQGKNTLAALKERANIEVDPARKQKLGEMTTYFAKMSRTQAKIRNDLFGSALTDTEKVESNKFLVADTDSPTQAKSKMDSFMDMTQKAVARLYYISRNPKGLSIKDVTLDDMPQLVQKRWDELEKDLADRIENPDARNRAIRDQVAREFGLVNQ